MTTIASITTRTGHTWTVGKADVTAITWTVDRRWGVNYYFYKVMHADDSFHEVYVDAVDIVLKK